jgi:hypothetical protein
MVKLGGAPSDPRVQAHVDFARLIGFNALWIYGQEAGTWVEGRAHLTPAFRRLAAKGRERGLRLCVSLNPVAESRGRFVFTSTADEDRLVRFAALLHDRAGVSDLVLSFDDQPTVLTDLADIDRYGRSSAPAHLDLVRRVAPRLPAGMRLWLCAATYCDAHLGEGTGPYAKPFLEGLPALPPSIGIVWTGPLVVSPTITRADIESTRARLGGRPLLLYDNFPMSDGAPPGTMALALIPLAGRDPGIADVIAGYLACPMVQLGASRFTLLTIADFLRDPGRYDPRIARARAVTRLLGPKAPAETRFALDTQQLEWGEFPRDPTTLITAASRLHDPAFVESFTWTASRYPARIAAIETLDDVAMREDLLRAMRRRLAIARALPLTIEYLARKDAGRADADDVLARLNAERASWKSQRDTFYALESFLKAAGIPAAPTRPS